MKPGKSWKEKLEDSKNLPKVADLPDRMKAIWGEGTLVIPAPIEVDEIMRRVPKGKVTTVSHIRVALAEKHSATTACPLATGIFAWIAAHAAEEKVAAKPNARITPYWRTLQAGGVLNEKYPGGIATQEERLTAEGHRVVRKGKHLVVADLEKSLFDFGVRSE